MANPNDLYSLLDPVVETTLAMLQEGVNGALADHWDATADEPLRPICSTANHPVQPQQMSAGGLPLLTCYRFRQRQNEFSSVHANDSRISLQISYTAPDTAIDDMGERWPLLNAVWDQIVKTMCNGSVHYAGPTPFDVGVYEFFINSADKVERYLAPDSRLSPGLIYPSFLGRFDVSYRELPDLSALHPFLCLRAKYYTEGNASEPADLDQLIYTEEGKLFRDAVEPFDEEAN